jgi:hypothetical protein
MLLSTYIQNILVLQGFNFFWISRQTDACYTHISNSMKLSPSCEANSYFTSREITRILWYPKIHYRFQKSPPPVLVLIEPHDVSSNLSIRVVWMYHTPI